MYIFFVINLLVVVAFLGDTRKLIGNSLPLSAVVGKIKFEVLVSRWSI